jgi:hypothetical protein
MITLAQIQKRYMKPINRSFKMQIEKYISVPEVQHYIEKAMYYSLEKEDYRKLGEIGGHKGKYQYLYWLCCIYIHPLTIAQHIVTEASKIK